MEVVVLDASILLKWVLAGEDKIEEEKSLEILNDWLSEKIKIILPSLWFYEVANILGLKRPAQAAELMDLLADYKFEEVKITKKIYRNALSLMRELKVSFYDAVYHASALEYKGTFITADKRYYNKAINKKNIKLLSA